MNRLPILIMLGLALAQLCSAVTVAAASPVDDVSASVAMVVVLEAPKFEDVDFGGHGKLPLAIPNVRLGTGFVATKSGLIMTSKALVQNAVAIAVRLPHRDGSDTVIGSGLPATVVMSSSNADLAVLALASQEQCTPLTINKQAPEVTDKQKLLKIGFGEHLGLYSRKLSQRETAVSNSSVYRPQNEGKGFLVTSRTTDSDAGSLLLDESGQVAGVLAARTRGAEDGFAVPAKSVGEYIEQALATYVQIKKFEDDLEAKASVLLAAFADHVLESQKDEKDHLKRYFLEDRWRQGIGQAFEKSALLQDRPAVVIIYALAWNLAVVNALQALDHGDTPTQTASCATLVGLHSKMVQIKGHPGLQTSPFVQDNIEQYQRVARATKCLDLLNLIEGLARAIASAAREKESKPTTMATTVPIIDAPSVSPSLSRFGLYLGAGGSFDDPSVLGSSDLSGQVGLQLSGGGLIRLFSAVHRSRLEYSLLTGLGVQWHHSLRILNPYIDFGMRLRVGLPIGMALTVLYSPGMLVDFPAGTDSHFAFSWTVLRTQLSVIIRWFALGVGWTADFKTITAAPSGPTADNTLALPAHTLLGFIEFFY